MLFTAGQATGLEIFDKRSVVPLEEHDFDRWLTCAVEEARDMMSLPALGVIDAGPAVDEAAPPAEEESAEA